MSAPSTLFPTEPATRGGPPPRTLADLLAVVYRQAPLIAGCTLALSLAGLLVYSQQPRLYTSSAKVWVQTEQQGSPSFLSGIAAYRETPYPDPVNRKIETEIELMLTRTNAQAVVEKLDIRDRQMAKGVGGKLRARLASLFGGGDDAPVPPASRARTVDLFLDGISIEPLRSKTADTTSNVLEVKFECTDPQLAPLALQAFLDNYLQLGAQQNRRLGETTSRLIEAKLGQAKDELRKAEDDIVTLLIKDGNRALPLVAGGRTAAGTGGSTGAGTGTGTATGSTLGGSAAPAATPLAAAGLRLDTDPELAVGGTPGQVVAALKTQSLDLQLRLDEARLQFTDEAENVRSLRARLDATRKRLAVTVRENTQLEAQLNRLERQRSLAQERYVELQRKLDQIDLYLKLNPTESESRVVIDAPYRPAEGEGRKKPLVMLLGPAAGLLLGLLLAALRELGGDRLRSSRDVEWSLGVPLLGAVPTLPQRARDHLLGDAFEVSTHAPLTTTQ